MDDPLTQKLRSFGKPVPKKPTGPGTPSQTGKVYGTTPKPKPKSKRTKPSTPTDTSDMPEGLRKAYEDQGTIPPLEDSKVQTISEQAADTAVKRGFIDRPSPKQEPKGKTYTKQGFVQRTYTIYQDTGKAVTQAEKVYAEIDPSKEYVTPSWFPGYRKGQSQSVTGWRLRQEIKTKYITPGYTYQEQARQQWQFAMSGQQEWHPDTKIIETDTGFEYKFPYTGAEKYGTYKSSLTKSGFTGLLATAFTAEDPLGLKSAYYTATGDKQKALDVKIQAIHGTKSRSFPEFYISSPMGTIGAAALTATGVGAGVGAISAASATAGKLTSIGLATAFTAKTAIDVGPKVQKAFDTGDYGDLVGTATTAGLAIGAGYSGYKAGYTAGYGRTEAFLYGRSTYKVGSPEYIQYKSALKTARNLQFVKSGEIKALDVSKDIMRLDPKTAGRVISYLQRNPRTVIGGSASAYAQLQGVRTPQDIDLLVKDVRGAKMSIDARPHQVDIHGFDFGGKPGKYIRLGFETQRPVKGYILGGKRFNVKLLPKYEQEMGTLGMTYTGRKDIFIHPGALQKGMGQLEGVVMSRSQIAKIILKHEMIHQKHSLWPERLVLIGERKGFFPELFMSADKYMKGSQLRFPTKVKLMSAGEQVGRKGTASVMKEFQYRWFKDRPDFVSISKGLIRSGKKSYNPFTKIKIKVAEQNLKTFLQPTKAAGYGKTSTIFGKVTTRVAKRLYTPGKTPSVISGVYPRTYSYPIAYTMPYIPTKVTQSYYTSTRKQNYVPTIKTIRTSLSMPSLYTKGYTPTSPRTPTIMKTTSPRTPTYTPPSPYPSAPPPPKITTPYVPTEPKGRNIQSKVRDINVQQRKYLVLSSGKPYKIPGYKFRKFNIPGLRELIG